MKPRQWLKWLWPGGPPLVRTDSTRSPSGTREEWDGVESVPTDAPVAQIFNLLYRRFATCGASFAQTARRVISTFGRLQIGDTAECNSALRSSRLAAFSCVSWFLLLVGNAHAATVADPAISPASGTVVPVSMSLSCATPDAVIRYTLDGSVPGVTSPVFYTNLVCTNLTMVRARAFKEGMDPSGTVFAYYVEPQTRTDMGYYRTVTNDAGRLQPLVSVTIAGASNVTCFTIEERLPAIVAPVEIDNDGQWLPALGVVRWGPYTNVPTVTVSYRIDGMAGSYTIGGIGWADGRWKFEPGDSTATILSGADVTSVPSAPTPVAAPVIAPLALQAEDASYGGGVAIATTNAGFNGTGFASFTNTGSFLQFNGVNGGVGGAATLSIRFALGASSRTGRIIVNGITNTITFSTTGTWTNWSLLTNRITLNGGVANTIRFESSGSGLANLDEITVNPDNGAAPVSVVMSCATPGAVIYYTLDGTLPTTASLLYAGPLSLPDAAVVRARAFKDGFAPSVATVANFAGPPAIGPAALSRSVLTNVLWAPVMNLGFTPGTGAVCQALEETVPGELTISSVSGDGVWSNGVIRWGPFFDTNGQAFSYQATGPSGSYTVQARWSRDGAGVDLGGTNLSIGSAGGGVVVPVKPSSLPAPVLTPTFSASLPVTVTITNAVAGVEIHYTTDGTTPGTNSPLYATGLNITSTTTLRARAFLPGCQASDAVVGYYGSATNDAGTWLEVVRTITENSTATPLITLTATPHGSVSACTVMEALPLGLAAFSTTRNPVWNETNRTLKWGPFTNEIAVMTYRVSGVAGSFVCDGQASMDGYPVAVTGQSNLVVGSAGGGYVVPVKPPKLPTPLLTPPNSTSLPVLVAASCAASGAELHYTLDGTTPTTNAALYSGTLQFTTTTTLRLRAFLSGWEASDSVVGYYQPPASATGLTVTRSITNSPGYAPLVKLTATPIGNVSAYTVTESVPYGITPFAATSAAVWNAANRTLKWGPFTNEVRVLSYQLSGVSASYVLSGDGSVDGFPVLVGGASNVVVNVGLMPDPAPPAVTLQPLSQPVATGSDLVLYVEAVGAPAPSYQWRKDGVGIDGATSQLFVRTNFQSADVGGYEVVVSNTVGVVTSQVAVVSMAAAQTRLVFGQVELDYYAGPTGSGRGTRTVTFKASKDDGTVLATWSLPLDFAPDGSHRYVADYTLGNVPIGATHLSAKTAWSLRKRLLIVLVGELAEVNFTASVALPSGDLNDSNIVDLGDYYTLAGSWGTSSPAADLDGNGWVDLDDYFLLASHWNEIGEPE